MPDTIRIQTLSAFVAESFDCFEPPVLSVDLEQHARDAAPRVLSGEKHSPRYNLTVTEAPCSAGPCSRPVTSPTCQPDRRELPRAALRHHLGSAARVSGGAGYRWRRSQGPKRRTRP